MTDDDLDRAEQLAAAATPGPWCAYFSAHGDPYVLGRPVDRGGREPLFPQDTVAATAETVPIEGGVEWRCPTHGAVGVRLDGGNLDLGIIRDGAVRPDGDLPVFIERVEPASGPDATPDP